MFLTKKKYILAGKIYVMSEEKINSIYIEKRYISLVVLVSEGSGTTRRLCLFRGRRMQPVKNHPDLMRFCVCEGRFGGGGVGRLGWKSL